MNNNIKYFYYQLILLYLRVVYVFRCLYFIITNKKPEKPKDPIEEYSNKYREKLIKTFETETEESFSSNILPVIYQKKEFFELLKDENNELESSWKSRILYEITPRGTVVMYYDIYKQGFAYYSDQSFIPYSVLNAVAMRYVMVFRCRDFYMDESVLEKRERLSILVDVFELEPKEVKVQNNKTEKQEISGPYAKLKNYKLTTTPVNNKTEEKMEKPLLKNHFINKGKMYNFMVLKKVEKKEQPISTSYDSLFKNVAKKKISYKDFKKVTQQ